MRNRIIIGILTILHMSCYTARERRASEYLDGSINKRLMYDTLDGYFLYEKEIPSYIVYDAKVKSHGLIHEGTLNDDLYRKGIFYFHPELVKNLSLGTLCLRSDIESLSQFYLIVQDSLIFGWTDKGALTSAGCGFYYKPLYLNAEVVFVGNKYQRTPSFKNCGTKPEGKNYTYRKLPTYIITKIITYQFK